MENAKAGKFLSLPPGRPGIPSVTIIIILTPAYSHAGHGPGG